MEHMWTGSRLGEACMFLELSPHSLGFHTPAFHCDSSSSGYPSLGGAARLIRHVRGPPQGCFCSSDVLFLFSDQRSTAVHSSYWVPLHLVPWSPFPRSSSVCELAWVSFEEVKELEVNTRGCPRQLDTCIVQAVLCFTQKWPTPGMLGPSKPSTLTLP